MNSTTRAPVDLNTFAFVSNPENANIPLKVIAGFTLTPFKEGYVVYDSLNTQVLLCTAFVDVATDFVQFRDKAFLKAEAYDITKSRYYIYSSTPLGDIYKVF